MNPSYITSLQTSLTLSQLLDKAGIKVETEYYWEPYQDSWHIVQYDKEEVELYRKLSDKLYPAFLTDELLGILTKVFMQAKRFEMTYVVDEWYCYWTERYYDKDSGDFVENKTPATKDKLLPEALAKTLTYLLEQGLIK